MKSLITLILVGIVAAACSSPASSNETSQGNTANESQAQADQSNPAPATEASNESGNSSAAPLGITAGPPAIKLGPPQGTPPSFVVSTPPPLSDWQTFSSSDLGVTLNYPPEWTVDEQTGMVTFTSPQGKTVTLQIAGGNEQTDQNCIALTNSYGVTGNLCNDSAANKYSATVDIKSANGSVQKLVLSTASSDAVEVYKLMFNSLHKS